MLIYMPFSRYYKERTKNSRTSRRVRRDCIVAALHEVGRSSLHGRGLSIIVDALLHTTRPVDHTRLTGRAKLAGIAVSLLISVLISGNIIHRKAPDMRSSCKHPDAPLLVTKNQCYNVNLRIGASNCNAVILSLSNAIITRH